LRNIEEFSGPTKSSKHFCVGLSNDDWLMGRAQVWPLRVVLGFYLFFFPNKIKEMSGTRSIESIHPEVFASLALKFAMIPGIYPGHAQPSCT
jgi:hypothetical protein